MYSTPTPLTGNFTDANHGTDNSMSIKQVTSDWNPATLGWFNLPSTITTNQVIVPATTQPKLDVELDVAGMIRSMITTQKNFGFLLNLQKEVIYTSRIFVSSYSTTYPDKHPKLVVVYQ